MINIDSFDERILQELEINGNISNIQLSKKIGLSPSATLRRVQELEKLGVITGYKAVIDQSKLGVLFKAYITLGLNSHSKASQKSFEKAIVKAKEVLECHNIAGTYAYILKVEAKDVLSYKDFHSEVLSSLSQVSTIQTLVILESVKE